MFRSAATTVTAVAVGSTVLLTGSAISSATAAEATVTTPAAVAAPAASKVRVSNGAQGTKLRKRVARVASAQAGDRYSMGATGPRAFDCSGLVVYSYKKATGKTLPRTSYAQIGAVERVKAKHRKVGDIVFFRGNGHVGIYLGKRRIVHALNPGAGVRFDRTDSGWSGSMINGYGRVITTH